MQTPSGIEDHGQLTDWLIAVPNNDSNINTTILPIDMQFNDGHLLSIIVYSIMMVISASANITVLVLILQRRRKMPSRINTMLMHLAIADLLVTFLLMPLEIGWAITVSWKSTDAMCRIMAFFRTFGLYLSSFILVCISIDRYYAVLKPLHLTGIDRRGKYMIAGAWIASTLCSAPQMWVFHVERHPNITWYYQCITVNSFPSYTHELTYSLFGMVVMYGMPLTVIVFSYASILVEIFQRSRETASDNIRRSSLGFLGRAKIRTLKMTIIIVLVFFICWTPYYVMCMWYWYDRDSALKVDQRVQRGLFLFACTNSCMNPIVYGAFNIRARRAGVLQVPEAGNSRLQRSSVMGTRNGMNNSRRQAPAVERGGVDMVCLVSWKQRNSGANIHHRRDVCLSCGESFELRVALTPPAASTPNSKTTLGLCSLNGK